MQEVLKNKLEELSKEAGGLVNQREQLVTMLGELEVRLHQISGAISEIDKILKSIENKS